MFQKSILRNFVKAFSISGYEKLKKLCCQKNKIDEDANGAEFLLYLAKFLDWKNYTREVKNKLDMKKADGVVYNNENQPIAIIELKSSDKKILNRDIIEQAFRYKNEKPTCKYVIISNFKELNIFCESSDVSFDIDMTKDESYKTLYALLNEHSLEDNEISRLKKISKTQEEITKEVYKEYSNFRLKLLTNLIQNNEKISKEVIFESANKLLDRFMFILFAEDRGLIPANSIDAIIKQYENAHEWGEDTLLYEYYKKYFHFIDVGNAKVNIPKYNGNLFKPDEQLDSLVIDDHIIKADLSHLSAYDFSDDVDVEVLGHIFEQSLNDLEKIKESLFVEHKIVDSRKKDGVFYTPKFITEYIINNTVAKLCETKKEDLKLFDEMKETKKAKEKRRNTLHEYREYLEDLKIVDPACGSGAFLTASFRYLLEEHKWIQKELGKADAGLFDFHDIDKQIIEKNLFGVDINGASVGIAKLSLWLQTAKRDRPLSNLMENIKSANSLTADWNALFPEIMADGGFDCVVGNPPYGVKLLKEKEYFKIKSNESAILFMQKAFDILKDNGAHSFIIPKPFIYASSWKKIRDKFVENISDIVDCGKVWEDVRLEQIIYVFNKIRKKLEYKNHKLQDKKFSLIATIDKKMFDRFGFFLNDVNEIEIELGIKINSYDKLSSNTIIDNRGDTFQKLVKEKGNLKVLAGATIQQHELAKLKGYIGNDVKVSQNAFIRDNSILLQRLIAHIKYPTKHIKITGTIVEESVNYRIIDTVYQITLNDKFSNKYILSIMHSKLMNWYVYRFIFAKAIRTFQFSNDVIKNIPIPNIPKSYKIYKENINYLINLSQHKKYDKEKRFAVAIVGNKELYITEFLFAKQRGYIKNYDGHRDLELSFYKLLPYLAPNISIILENSDDKRVVYGINLDNKRTLLIVIDGNMIVSIFIQNNKHLTKQIKNRRFKVVNQLGETTTPLILYCPAGSCTKAFWRQTDLLDILYKKIDSLSISQEPFMNLIDTIIDSKEKIVKYKKHFGSLNVVDKIEIKEEIEKLETLVLNSVNEIDSLVYGLYGLSSDEIKIIEEDNEK